MASAPRDQGLPTAASATGLHRGVKGVVESISSFSCLPLLIEKLYSPLSYVHNLLQYHQIQPCCSSNSSRRSVRCRKEEEEEQAYPLRLHQDLCRHLRVNRSHHSTIRWRLLPPLQCRSSITIMAPQARQHNNYKLLLLPLPCTIQDMKHHLHISSSSSSKSLYPKLSKRNYEGWRRIESLPEVSRLLFHFLLEKGRRHEMPFPPPMTTLQNVGGGRKST